MPQAYISWFVQKLKQGRKQNPPALDGKSTEILNAVNSYPHTLKIYPQKLLKTKHFEELGQFIRPLTTNLPDKVSVSNLMRRSVVARDFTCHLKCPSAKSPPISSPSTVSHFPGGPEQITGDHFLQVLPNSSKPVLQRHFGTAKRHSESHTVKAVG